MKKIGIPKGMRDFSPQVMAKRNYIFDVLKKAFLLYGFEQIETPAMENRETLTGKYGEEGDRLIFNVINSGDYLKKVKDIDELGYDDFTFFVFHIRSVLWLIVKGEFELNEITEQEVVKSLDLMDVDEMGLDRMDRKILQVIEEYYGGGPVGIEALCATLSEDRGTIEDVYEPYLLKEGFLLRTPRGRVISDKGRERLSSKS